MKPIKRCISAVNGRDAVLYHAPTTHLRQQTLVQAFNGKRLLVTFAILLTSAIPGSTQSVPSAQAFALSDIRDLALVNVKAEPVEYKGRKAVCITTDSQKDGFALLRGVDFQDGTIEADMALKITTPPGVRMPGFVGIGFRARPDVSRYELFYLRPGNANSDDQAMRNHSAQYVSIPDFDGTNSAGNGRGCMKAMLICNWRRGRTSELRSADGPPGFI